MIAKILGQLLLIYAEIVKESKVMLKHGRPTWATDIPFQDLSTVFDVGGGGGGDSKALLERITV